MEGGSAEEGEGEGCPVAAEILARAHGQKGTCALHTSCLTPKLQPAGSHGPIRFVLTSPLVPPLT